MTLSSIFFPACLFISAYATVLPVLPQAPRISTLNDTDSINGLFLSEPRPICHQHSPANPRPPRFLINEDCRAAINEWNIHYPGSGFLDFYKRSALEPMNVPKKFQSGTCEARVDLQHVGERHIQIDNLLRWFQRIRRHCVAGSMEWQSLGGRIEVAPMYGWEPYLILELRGSGRRWIGGLDHKGEST